ncbi:alpha/beta hydrolase [Mycolicibacterium sp. 050158]|uniref:alpha/beta hydrolase n=1 Tax=Mycolicibacterium sp. 050158 TaxID=3090602 RepID=UPI00299F52E1|nr:alpha/beta fold hydrolase [Mycolicibacterium sp. 050158]MDX1889912.1 alpha/beta fold hydrolase [Mycolicibacterium sp. 050158]
MPFLDTEDGRAYYRHWAAENPRAAIIFLHGFGEHTGLYHRYGFALNAAGIDLWAVDQFGHGLTPGERGDFRSLEASIGLADRLAELAAAETPDLPFVAQGHSFGAAATLWKLLDGPQTAAGPYRAAVVSGAPLVPVPGLVDADSTFEIAPTQLSADPFYLDAIENDPLAFVDADGGPLARELDRVWDGLGARLPGLTVAALAVHGENDPIAPVGAVRAYAEQIEALSLVEIPGGGHDILNDVTHREIASRISTFVLDRL